MAIGWIAGNGVIAAAWVPPAIERGIGWPLIMANITSHAWLSAVFTAPAWLLLFLPAYYLIPPGGWLRKPLPALCVGALCGLCAMLAVLTLVLRGERSWSSFFSAETAPFLVAAAATGGTAAWVAAMIQRRRNL